ncbi:sensor histidine kinase [Mariniflexile sp. AS56]|uniref:sensor histidine kinase n=1 Tax=Mariniflexile sp. AS56 TaxID=3063957 RepID=UPI0026EE550D|nr:ATP-binding protein [Mariniflexile sp. AS56]MDO7171870.1 ATP-binding protein [Mariniflexile sp. AS56]
MLTSFWKRYQDWYMDYIGFSKRNKQEGLTYFRDKLFVSILLLTSVIGVVSYIPSAVLAIYTGELFVLYIDTFAVLILLFLSFYKGMSLGMRKVIFSTNLFLLSFSLFVYLGFGGNGVTLLFMLNIMITLYSGRDKGLNAVFINALFYALLVICVYFDFVALTLPCFNAYAIEVLIVILMNNILFNLLIVFAVSFLIELLHSALLKQNKLQLELFEEHRNILKEKEKVESSDRLKTAFLANMSHEIRTPMYGILGCAEFLKAYNKDDKDYLEYVNVIESNGEVLLDVVSDILEISKIEAGLVTLNATTFNICETVNEVYKDLLPLAIEKGLTFRNDDFINPNSCIVNSDQAKLSSLLKHLIKNAIKYTDEGGRVSLKSISPTPNTLEFYVEDTGIGISEAYFKTIFDPFYQVDLENKKALHGSGIGLAIAKAYTEILGGELRLESKEGVGSTFWFVIDTNINQH